MNKKFPISFDIQSNFVERTKFYDKLVRYCYRFFGNEVEYCFDKVERRFDTVVAGVDGALETVCEFLFEDLSSRTELQPSTAV